MLLSLPGMPYAGSHICTVKTLDQKVKCLRPLLYLVTGFVASKVGQLSQLQSVKILGQEGFSAFSLWVLKGLQYQHLLAHPQMLKVWPLL